MTHLLGYVRVNREEQSVEMQVRALIEAGAGTLSSHWDTRLWGRLSRNSVGVPQQGERSPSPKGTRHAGYHHPSPP